MDLRTCFVAVLIAAASASAGPAVKMSFRPDTILPGTSADITITIRNATAEVLRLKPYVMFEAVPPQGDRFFASRDHTSSEQTQRYIPAIFLAEDSTIVIDRGEDFTFSIPFFWPTTPFRDPRFTATGRYEITGSMETDAGILLKTAPVALFVFEPQGEDANVWRRMMQTCGKGCAWGHWQNRGLWQGILEDFPASEYARYATGYDFRDEANASWLRSVGVSGPYREQIFLFEADTVAGEVLTDAIFSGDEDAAVRAANEKRALLTDLVRTSPDPFVRAEAAAALAEVPSAADVIDNIRGLEEAKRTRP